MAVTKDYFVLLESLKKTLSRGLDFIQSAIVYGSVCRLELIEGESDLDLLVLLHSDVLTSEVASFFAKMVEDLYCEFKIKIHLRIRNAKDLKERTSGFLDCGFTSSINKLRDSILLVGEPLDEDYLAFIQSASVDMIEENLYYRFSDVRYRVRALVSAGADNSIYRPSLKVIRYRVGCLICQFAELVCYSHGLLFINSADALQKARGITSNNLFSEAMALKRDESDLNLFKAISLLDELILDSQKRVEFPSLLALKRIRVVDSSFDGINDETAARWRHLRSDSLIPPGFPLVVKTSSIEDGVLIINRFAI